jgi:hypothetical protein
MRKRSKYRPKGVRLDTMAWVKQGIAPMASHNEAVLALRIKNHSALASITKGIATRDDVDLLIAAINMTEALAMQGLGKDWREEITAAQAAVLTMARRGLAKGDRFLFTGPELTAVNLAMEIHDAQIDQASVLDLEKALDTVNRIIVAGKATPVEKRTQEEEARVA